MKPLHRAIKLLRHQRLMHRQRFENAAVPMILHRHEFVRSEFFLEPPPVVRVEGHGDVVVVVEGHDDHFAVFAVDGAEARVGAVYVGGDGGVGGGAAGGGGGDKVLLVVRTPDDHAWFEHFFREPRAFISCGFSKEWVALVRGETGLLVVGDGFAPVGVDGSAAV